MHISTHLHVSTHTHAQAYTHTHAHVCSLHTHTHTHKHTHTNIHTRARAISRARAHTHTHSIRAYTHTRACVLDEHIALTRKCMYAMFSVFLCCSVFQNVTPKRIVLCCSVFQNVKPNSYSRHVGAPSNEVFILIFQEVCHGQFRQDTVWSRSQ